MSKDIAKYKFKPGLPIEFEIADLLKLYQHKREMLVRPHRAGFYHILWLKKGSSVHMVDFNPIVLQENTLLFLNKDVVQIYDAEHPFNGVGILFTDTFFASSGTDIKFLKNSVLYNNILSISTLQLNKEIQEPFDALFKLMENEVRRSKDEFQPAILKNHLHAFLTHAEREIRKQGFPEIKKSADRDYIILLRDLVEVYFKEQKQVSFYASKLSVTEKRLNLASSKIFGKTVKQVIDDRVLLEAKRLLAHTSDSIKEIGFNLGFDEPTNFIKYFKKHNSSTPVEFRESFLES